MTSLKTLALAAVAVAGVSMYATADAEARGFRGGGGGFHRGGGMHLGGMRHFGGRHLGFHRHGGLHRFHLGPRRGIWRHGRWIGLGVVGVGASCYRYQWIQTPYGAVRRLVNICAY